MAVRFFFVFFFAAAYKSYDTKFDIFTDEIAAENNLLPYQYFEKGKLTYMRVCILASESF